MVANIIMIVDIKNQITFLLLSFSTYLSEFNILHVIFNSVSVYILNKYITSINFINFINLSNLLNYTYITVSLKEYKKIIQIYIQDGIIDINKHETVIYVKNIYIIRKICSLFDNNNRYNKKMFDIMNTDKFPSSSNIIKINTRDNFDIDQVNNKKINDKSQINEQIVIKKISSRDDINNEVTPLINTSMDLSKSMSELNIDESVFQLEDDDFISEISVESEIKEINNEEINKNITVYRKNEVFSIINNYCDK